MNQPNGQQPEDNDQDQDHNHIHHSIKTEIFTDFEGMGGSGNRHHQREGVSTSTSTTTWKWKISALEAKNKLLEGENRMLEGKLENQECNAIIRTLTTQSLLHKLKQEKREIFKKLKEAEDSEQMANNKLKKIMQVIQQEDRTEKKIWSSGKEFTGILQEKRQHPHPQKQQHQKQPQQPPQQHQQRQQQQHQKQHQKQPQPQLKQQKQHQKHQQKSSSTFCRIHLDLDSIEHIHIDNFCCRLYKETQINVSAPNC